MILTCPACSTQYAVKLGAIPEGGRQVRCAACRHSWHQDPDPAETSEPEDAGIADQPPAAGEGEAGESAAGRDEAGRDEAGVDEPVGAPEQPPAEPPGYSAIDPIGLPEDAVAETKEEPLPGGEIGGPDEAPADRDEWRPPERDDEFSPFAGRPDAADGQGAPLRGILIGLLVLAVLGAAFWVFAPAEWKARVGLAQASDTPLQLMMTHSDRQRLESGNELLAVTGRVINPTRESQRVPPIRAQLRSRSGELVYSWTIAPPAPVLAPGASATFNSAEVNVPAGGDELTISLGTPSA